MLSRVPQPPEAIGRLVNSSYGWFAKTFHALPSKIQKADAARYLILHSEGGLYVDVDIECLHAFDELRADAPSPLVDRHRDRLQDVVVHEREAHKLSILLGDDDASVALLALRY